MSFIDAESAAMSTKVLKLMGNRFEISVGDPDPQWANECIDAAVAEIRRIEELLTTFKESSQTNLINRNAGVQPVKVDKEVFDLISRSLKISALTQGAFDISYGSIDKNLWNFNTSMTSLPDRETAKQSVKLINFRNVILNEKDNSVFLKEKGMRIGFGGIGKGYAADRAKNILKQMGVADGVVNAAGDLVTWGSQINGKPWTIGIADPNIQHHPFSYLNISNMAVATSGNYEKFFYANGKRWSHIMDPRTGYPAQGMRSVSVIAPRTIDSEVWAKPYYILGRKWTSRHKKCGFRVFMCEDQPGTNCAWVR